MSPTLSFLETRLNGFKPRCGLVLGSGLGFFADTRLQVAGRLAFRDIPGFPAPTVTGHAGNLVWGTCAGQAVLCFQGRFHFYEGHPMETVILPARLLAQLGGEILLLTNAAGGIAPGMRPGDLMLIEDHINFMGVNPLRGPNADDLGPRFPDLTAVYDRGLRGLAREAAAEIGLDLREGVYLACSGPTFETPAEIRAFQRWGASAVGMSTVPEAVAARHAGLRVCGISCITNLGAGLGPGELTHEEVGETAARVREPFSRLLEGLLARL